MIDQVDWVDGVVVVAAHPRVQGRAVGGVGGGARLKRGRQSCL